MRVFNQTRILDRAPARLKRRQLRELVAVGKHGNIRNAARSMSIPHPATTTMIHDLDPDFEMKLFERVSRPLKKSLANRLGL